MKYIQALLLLILLVTNRRFRDKWREATHRLSEANDAVGASLRRMDALKNGDKPRVRLL